MSNDIIIHIRKCMNMNQVEFGVLLGVSFTTVGRWENTNYPMSRTLSDQLISFKELIEDKDIDISKITVLSNLVGILGVLALATTAGFKFTTLTGSYISHTLNSMIDDITITEMINIGLKKLIYKD